jgi:glycosyltransferase involved in cell wall biosynthesis
MLNPGLVGLSILDSFALELPLVTTSFESQAAEIAYLDSGRNGIMTENSEEAFVQGVVDLFKDRSLIRRLAYACKEDSSRYSLENMAANYCKGIIDALRMS